jgi:hypothetical protein
MRCEGCAGKHLFAERQQSPAAAAGQEAEVPDANETPRQHVQQKAAQELINRQSEESFPVFMSGISPAKRNPIIGERDEAVIGDCHPMSIGAKVAKHLFGSAERWFAVDHPAWGVKLADEISKQFGFRQALEQAVEL